MPNSIQVATGRTAGFLGIYLLSSLPFLPGILFGLGRWDSYGGFAAWLALTPVFFAGAHYISKWSGFGGLSGLGLSLRRRWIGVLAVGFAFGALMVGLRTAAEVVAGSATVQGIRPWDDMLGLLLQSLINFVFVAFSEEIVDRGYLVRALSDRLSPAWVAILTSLLFAGSHFLKQSFSVSYLIHLTVAGLVYWAAVYATDSLWLAIGLHWGWDVFGINQGVFLVRQPVAATPPAVQVFDLVLHVLVLVALLALRPRLRRRIPAQKAA